MQIGAHTVLHPIHARTPLNIVREEIMGNKNNLESILNHPVHLFAYPNGKPRIDYLLAHDDLVRDFGFSAAVSTGRGAATIESDIFSYRASRCGIRHVLYLLCAR